MRRLKELSGRLLAQRVLALSIGEPVRRIRLTTLELANLKLARVALDVLRHPGIESRFVETMRFSNGSSILGGHRGHWSSLSRGPEPITAGPTASH